MSNQPLFRKAIVAVLSVMMMGSLRAQDPRKVNDSLERSVHEMNNTLLAAHRTWGSKADTDTTFARVLKRVDGIDFKVMKIADWDYSSNKYNAQPQLRYKQKLYKELEIYALLLDRAYKLNALDSITSILRFIDEDISLKMDNAWAASPVPPALVNLKVRVLEAPSGTEVPGVKVFIRPQLAPDRYTEEFNPTNNALKRIMPGIKLVWIEQGGRKAGERTIVVPAGVESDTIDFYIEKK
ncbi:hypothetical protein [Chitinophaga sp. 22620]|uniref:hypothetical protein n=1 Tax=Chitinophaga sp. 22620 TaxID=3453952 RepID=UPI003F84812A